MTYLSKFNGQRKDAMKVVCKPLQIYIEDHREWQGGFLYYNRYQKRVYVEQGRYIPDYFIGDRIAFQSSQSFQQNHIHLGPPIRKSVLEHLSNNWKDEILCIGGESYLYGLFMEGVKKMWHWTNSQYIHEDCQFMSTFYQKEKEVVSCQIDYSKFSLDFIPLSCSIVCINLAHLPSTICEVLRDCKWIETIVLVHCHGDEFWRKVKKYWKGQYWIQKREQYVCEHLHYMITVNIFQRV